MNFENFAAFNRVFVQLERLRFTLFSSRCDFPCVFRESAWYLRYRTFIRPETPRLLVPMFSRSPFSNPIEITFASQSCRRSHTICQNVCHTPHAICILDSSVWLTPRASPFLRGQVCLGCWRRPPALRRAVPSGRCW